MIKYNSPIIEVTDISVENGFADSGYGEYNFPGTEPEETNYGDFNF